MLNFIMASYNWSQGRKKGYHQIWEANLQPLGANVPAFISNLGANLQLKNAQSWPQVFFGP
jgi:hypothetical protein